MAITDGMRILGYRQSADPSGLVVTTISYLCTNPDTIATLAPAPNSGNKVSVSAQRDDAGNWIAQITSETSANKSNSGISQSDLVTEELSFAMKQEPIQANPWFETLIQSYPWDKTQEQFSKTLKDGKTSNPMFGTKDVLAFGGTFRRRQTLSFIPDDLLDRVGAIDPTFAPRKIAFIADKGFNWLKLGPSVRSRGDAWEISQEWQLSGWGGWNADIYGWENLTIA